MTEQEFHDLMYVWSKETEYVSSTEKICEHYAFRQLIEAGKSIVPYIHYMLAANENRLLLMLVLCEIFGFSPVKEENQGMIADMTKDWLEYLQGN